MSHEWCLELLDGTRRFAVELDEYAFECILRHNAPGNWRLTTALTASAGTYGQFLGYGSGVALVRDNETIMVGVLEQREIHEAGDVATLTLSGRDALVHLEDRWVDPMDGDGSNDDYDLGPAYSEMTGAAETVIRHYANVNALGGGRADRVVPNFVLSGAGDSGSGGTVTTKARFENLLEMLQKIAATAEPEGVGLRLVVTESFQVAPGRLEFRVETPRDLRNLVIFDRRSASSLVLREVAPAVNAVLVAGEGEGTQQALLEVTNSASVSRWRRRIERFLDARNESDPAAMTSKANAELTQGDGGFEFEVTPLDAAPWRYGRDYSLGDRVGVEVAGYAGDGIVLEVRIQIASPGGVSITPLIGTEGATFTPVAQRRTAALESRVGHLERINQFGTPGIAIIWTRAPEEIPIGWAVSDGGTYNGFQTFDLRGRVPVGVDGAHALGAAGGALTANLQHTHTINHTHAFPHDHDVAGTALLTDPSFVNNAQTATGPGTHPDTIAIHTHVTQAATTAQNTTTTGGTNTTNSGNGGSTSQSLEQPWRGVYWLVRIPAA